MFMSHAEYMFNACFCQNLLDWSQISFAAFESSIALLVLYYHYYNYIARLWKVQMLKIYFLILPVVELFGFFLTGKTYIHVLWLVSGCSFVMWYYCAFIQITSNIYLICLPPCIVLGSTTERSPTKASRITVQTFHVWRASPATQGSGATTQRSELIAQSSKRSAYISLHIEMYTSWLKISMYMYPWVYNLIQCTLYNHAMINLLIMC